MTEPVSDIHAAARRFASSGVPVFPCWPNSKTPFTQHGFHDATTDLEIIDGWWTGEPRLNLAFCPHEVGLSVIDIDGEDGEASWEHWQIEHGYLPLTYTVNTPRGGRHLYYHGVLPPTVGKLGFHVDTRGQGSYALLPPSVFQGKPYILADSRTPAELPDSVNEFLAALQRDKVKAAVADLDLPQNVARARRYLEDQVAAGRVAIQGHAGDETTYAVACETLNLGVSPEVCFEIMWELWAPHAEPFDERFEGFLKFKIENASRYAQNEAGAWAVSSSGDVFGAALDKLTTEEKEDETAQPSPTKRRFKRWTLAEMLSLPPPAWLLPDILPDKGVALLYGQPGTLKTFIAIHWSCTLASFGIPVLYCAGEGSLGVAQRIKAWCTVHDVDPASLPLEIVRAAPWATDGGMIDEFIQQEAKPFKPELIVMDTLARSAIGLDENSAKDMGQIVALMDAIRTKVDCSVLVIHHAGKDENRGARGSGSLMGGVDAAFEVRKPAKHLPIVSVTCVRQKDTEERAEPWTFEGVKVGAAMVLNELSVAEFHARTATLPRLKPQEVGAALRSIGAIGESEAVQTRVLATALAGSNAATPEDADAAINGYATVLGRGAGGFLGAYCQGTPPNLSWFLSVDPD